jgi:hypothetical protein
MSLTVFLALCILGPDFMIYVLFKLLYGDRRSAIARRVAKQRKAAQAAAAGLIFVPARDGAPTRQAPEDAIGSRSSSREPRKFFCPNSYFRRIA